MADTNGNRNNSRIHKFSVILTWLIVAVMIILYIAGQFVYKHDALNTGVSKSLDGVWEYETEGGDSGTCTLPHRFDDMEYGQWLRLSSVLPDDITDGMYMCIMAGRSVRINIGGEDRFVHYGDESEIPGRIIKSAFFSVPLYARDAKAVITITKDEPGVFNGNVFDILYGDMYAMTREITSRYLVKFAMAVLMLAVSIVTCIAAFAIGRIYKLNTKALRLLGFGMLAASLWIITDSYMYQFVFGNIYIDGIISYMLTPILPIPFIRYINEVQKNRYEKQYDRVMLALIADEVIVSALHFADIYSFEMTLTYNDAVVVVAALAIIVGIVCDYRKGYINEYKWVAIGITGLIICSILEIFFINIHVQTLGGIWMVIGLYFMIFASLIHTMGDILNSERERRKAIESNKIKTTFLANMSHEIRTPINSIMGMNEMILRESGNEDITDYAEHIKRSCSLLLSIIGDVLDFSKIESGKMNICNDPYNTASLLGDLVNLLNQQAALKSLETTIDLAEDIPSVLDGDENHIKQILINLITNAVKYTSSGSVGLKAYTEQTEQPDRIMLIFKVKDTGIGIKKNDIDRLFDSFERADESKNRHIQGTGLGLSIVKNLTNAMDGAIDVDSIYGSGSTFTVRIPQRVISSKPVGQSWKNEQAQGLKTDNKYTASFMAPGANILAVDDNATNLLIIKQFLKQTKVNIVLCDNGTEALQLCSNNRYDMILLDHMMPEPDGTEVLKRIRADKNNPNNKAPIIVLTANVAKDSKDEYTAMGFNDYIGKPVDGLTLEHIIMKHLAKDLIIENNSGVSDSGADNHIAGDSGAGNRIAGDSGADNRMVGDSEAGKSGQKPETMDFYKNTVRVYNNEEFAQKIIEKVAENTLDTLDILKRDVKSGDYADYAIRAHGIKGMMASIYYESLRERSKSHEMAAKEGRIDYIKQDFEDYVTECREFCEQIINREDNHESRNGI